MTTATLGGITFNATDGDGVEWTFADLEGWWGPPVDLMTKPRPAGHGDVLSDARYRGRRISLKKGLIIAPSNTLLDQKRNELAAVVDLVTASGTLVVNESTPKQATVYLRDLRVRELTPTIAEFELELYAPDHRKYATSATAITGSGGFVVANAGNIASPLIDFSSVTGGQTVTNTTDSSKAIVTTGTGTLVIAVATRTVTKAGVNAYDQIASTTDWFELLPGNNSITVSTGSVTGTFRAAYI